jgi:hypothetical protein
MSLASGAGEFGEDSPGDDVVAGEQGGGGIVGGGDPGSVRIVRGGRREDVNPGR